MCSELPAELPVDVSAAASPEEAPLVADVAAIGTAEDGLLSVLAEHPLPIALAIAGVAFVESFAIAGIVVPGVAILAAAAFAAGGAGTPLSIALFAAGLGAVLGDGSSFLIGRHFGAGLRRRPFVARYAPWISRGERFFDRHGVLGIVAGRFVGPIRPVMPLVAGMLHMSPRRFFSANLISAVVWAPTYILPGYLVGASFADAVRLPDDWPIVLPLASVWVWISLRVVARAWRVGARAATSADSEAAVRALRRPLPGAGVHDTWLSALLGVTALAAAVLSGAALARLPSLAPWRALVAELLELTIRLW